LCHAGGGRMGGCVQETVKRFIRFGIYHRR
jgi:hypothetical protein